MRWTVQSFFIHMYNKNTNLLSNLSLNYSCTSVHNLRKRRTIIRVSTPAIAHQIITEKEHCLASGINNYIDPCSFQSSYDILVDRTYCAILSGGLWPPNSLNRNSFHKIWLPSEDTTEIPRLQLSILHKTTHQKK